MSEDRANMSNQAAEQLLAELMEENRRLKQALATANLGHVLVNSETGARSVSSPEYRKLYGLPADQSAQTMDEWLSNVHADDRNRAGEELLDALQDGAGPYTSEFRLKRPEGAPDKWIAARGAESLVHDASSDTTQLAITEQDVTDWHGKNVTTSLERRAPQLDLKPQVLWTVGSDGEILQVDDSWTTLTGQGVDDLLAGEWINIVHPEDRDLVVSTWHASLETGRPYDLEHRIRLNNGLYRWIRARARPEFSTDGRILRWQGVTEDIHPYREALATAKESEARFKAAIQAVNGILWTNSATGEMVGEQPGWAALTGQSFAEYQGYGWANVVHPEDAQPTVDAWNSAVEQRRPFLFEHRLRCHDGNWRVFSIRAIPIFDDRDEIVEWVGVHTDITNQRRAEDALREETRTLESLNRIGTALTSDLELSSIVQRVTDAATEVTGAAFGAFFYNVIDRGGERYTLYAISGVARAAFEKFPMPRNTKVFAPTFHGEGIIRVDDITSDPRYGHNRPHRGMPDGHLPVRSYLAAPVVSASGEVLGGLFFGHPSPGIFTPRAEHLVQGIAAQAAIAVDNARLFQAAQQEVESRIKAENALRELNGQLERLVEERTAELMREADERRKAEEHLRQNEKLVALGQLTGGIAHDFNNIVQVVASGTMLLRKPNLTDERRTAILDGLSQAADNAKELTSRLLSFARKQALKPRLVDLNESIQSIAHLLRHTLGSNITIRTNLAGNLWSVSVDKGQLESAILNLAVNARDAMQPDGGLLELETANSHSRSGFKETEADFVVITVRDTGRGMSPSVQARVFEPFFTTKGSAGTGLGLAQVHGFAKQSGGDIEIESVEGAGTTVRFFLPRTRALDCTSEHPSAHHQDAQSIDLRDKAVLVVEDNANVAALSRALLEELHLRATVVPNADEAWALIQSGASFDVVFSDIVMPGSMNGIELVERLRAGNPTIAVVLASGYSETLARGYKLDVQVLTKPFKLGELADAIVKALANAHSPAQTHSNSP